MTLDYKNSHKLACKYHCELCNYATQRKFDYEKHLITVKHLRMTNDDENDENDDEKDENDENGATNKYKCNCGNTYKYRQGLFKHKNKCITTHKVLKTVDTKKKEINASAVMELIKENQEFKNMMIEQQKQVLDIQKQLVEMSKERKITTNNNNNSNNTTNNNNQFNLNFFLNETCKNAINFSDFIENIKVSYDDLENNAKLGFVNGMTKLIVDNLKQLELNDRPIHCTDAKRETIYVKEDDQWEKEKSKEVLQKGIQEITCKNMNQLMEWREENPEYDDMNSELSELSIGMQQHSMAGGKRDEFYSKIIKNMAKETTIEKNSK